MSDIPFARTNCREALAAIDRGDIDGARWYIRNALSLMTRRRPAFKTPKAVPPLSRLQRRLARHLRLNERLPLNEIATRLHTNIGRVSEAVNRWEAR